MYPVLTLLIGLVINFIFPPIGSFLAVAIILTIVAVNYRKTKIMHEDILAIKNHLGLMSKTEAADYEIDKQLDQVNRLDSAELSVINARIEAELEKESKGN